tara:strand:- start:702 stop:902 length:201 start_codon:yes stop_codon:yes gene_type:complete
MELIKIAEQFIDSKLDELKSEDVRKKIVDKWNSDINIPIIGEKTEEKILSALLDSVLAVVEKVIKK